jgi:hypothetical protein
MRQKGVDRKLCWGVRRDVQGEEERKTWARKIFT